MTEAATVLRRARERAGYNQDELARRAGVTQSVISAYESGRREPSLSTLRRLVEATGVALRLDLVGGRIPEPRRELPPTPRGAVLRRHRRRLLQLAAEHGASQVRVFGSTARGDDRPDSDVDLLVQLDPEVGLLELATLERQLGELLGTRVDIVPDRGLKPDVQAAVDAEAVAL